MHLKLLNIPKTWKVPRKGRKFSIRIIPGAHQKEFSIPILVLLRDYLKIVKTGKECKKIIHEKQVMVDNKVVNDQKFPTGLFDIISLPKHKLYYRISMDYKGRLVVVELDKKESVIKPLKVLNKTRLKGKIVQLNCSSGRNILVKKDVYKTGDTLIYDLTSKKIVKHLKSEKDKLVFITSGKHAGTIATITEFKPVMGPMPDRVILTDKQGKSFETLESYIFVIGEKKPEVTIL